MNMQLILRYDETQQFKHVLMGVNRDTKDGNILAVERIKVKHEEFDIITVSVIKIETIFLIGMRFKAVITDIYPNRVYHNLISIELKKIAQ